MQFTPNSNGDGSLQITITLDADDLAVLGQNSAAPGSSPTALSATTFAWGKTDYCVSCKDNNRYTIETYGDIAANIEAAATCFKQTGDPSYGLSKGSC